MKVKVSNIEGAKNITANKVYEVMEETAESYVITNDLNRRGVYKKYRFAVVTEEVVVITYKVGDKFEDNERNYMLIRDGNFVNLVSLKDGQCIGDWSLVGDFDRITEGEMAEIEEDWEDCPMTKI